MTIRKSLLVWIVVLSIMLFKNLASADSNIKNLILTDCEAAQLEFFKLSATEQAPLFDFFKRVLELKSPQSLEDTNSRDSYLLNRQTPGSSPFSVKPFGEDYFRSVSPTREVDAKICVLKIANAKAQYALRLLPGLFELETNPLLSSDTRFFLRKSLLEIAQINSEKSTEVKEVINEMLHKLNQKNSWLFVAIVVEFGGSAKESLFSMITNKEETIFETGLNILQISGSSQEVVAEILGNPVNVVTEKRTEKLLSSALKQSLSSVKLLRYILSKLPQPDQHKPIYYKLLSTSAESVLEIIAKDEQLETNFVAALLSQPIDQLSELVNMTCVEGRCDKSFKSVLKNSTGIGDSEFKVLTFLSLSENFDNELWKYAESVWKDPKSLNRGLALSVLSSFPAKKELASGFLTQAISDLSNKKLVIQKRPEFVRAVAQTMIKLSPVSASKIPRSLGEEILGLASDDSHLAALAISSIKPSPISLLIAQLQSKSETVVAETLLAIEKSHPLDIKLFSALLSLTGEVDSESTNSESKLSADRVLYSYGDAGIVTLEQLALTKDITIAKKAALRLLKQRNTNKIAIDVLNKNFNKLSCEGKFTALSYGNSLSSLKSELLKGCLPELLNSSSLRDKLVDIRQNLSVEEWKKLSEQIPFEIILGQCAREIFLVLPEELLAKLKTITGEISTSAIQCASNLVKNLDANTKEKFLVLAEERLKASDGPDISMLAAAIRLGSMTEESKKQLLRILNQDTISAALGDILKDNKSLSDLIFSLDDDDLTLSGMDNLICHSKPIDPRLEKRFSDLLLKEKDENMRSLIETVSCLNPNSTLLKEQLIRLVLSPAFDEIKESKFLEGLTNFNNDTKWPLRYLEKRLNFYQSKKH